MSVSLVDRRYGISGSQIFTSRQLVAHGALTAATAREEVVPASEYRALEAQVRELQRLLGMKTMESKLPREAVSRPAGQKAPAALDLIALEIVCERPWRQPAAPVHRAQQARRDGEDGHSCRTPSWSPTSARSSPSYRPTDIATSKPCSVGKPMRPGAQRTTQRTSTAS